jgi:hypothetical protein
MSVMVLNLQYLGIFFLINSQNSYSSLTYLVIICIPNKTNQMTTFFKNTVIHYCMKEGTGSGATNTLLRASVLLPAPD